MKSFNEIIARWEAERKANVNIEKPLLRAKIYRARTCIMEAADALAKKSTDAADLVAEAAFARCLDVVEIAQQSAAKVYSSISYDELKLLESEWQTDWTREAMVRIIERRSE